MWPDQPSPGVAPAKDQNPKPSFDIPAEYTDNIPGFLQSLFDQLDEVREESSRLWADEYAAVPIVRKVKTQPYQSNVKRRLQRERQQEELNAKEEALMGQIRELRWLLAAEPPADMSQSK